jgi:two-component system chemotaxis response regulator CheY
VEERLTIGKLSKSVNISADTLRYYDEIGLLKPAHRDADSGYRYYTMGQAKALGRILEFKEFGFSLDEIKEMLGSAELDDIYRKRYTAVLLEKLRLERIAKKLAVKINSLEQKEELFMSKKILLVDDAAFMRSMCREGFEKNGYEVVGEAENGEIGVKKFKELKPDVVVLNIVMPVMDGIEALRKIREYDPDAVVVISSASGQKTMVVEALNSGACRFVVKPFSMANLLAAVNAEHVPFNPEALKLLSMGDIDPDEKALSQQSIDEIIAIALADTEKAKAMLDKFMPRSNADYA